MHLCKEYRFGEIKGFKLGWSLVGPPLMTVYCYTCGDLMLDTGQAHMRKEVLDLAAKQGIRRICLTHHHEDHSGNAAALKQTRHASVFGHPLTGKKLAVPFPILPYQKYVWGRTTPLEIEPLPENIETKLGGMQPVHTPGHAKDHTVFWLKETGVLISGDLYLADNIKFFRVDENVGAQIDSLRKVAQLDFDTLLCGHHPKLTGGKKRIKNKLAFLETLYGRVAALRDKGYDARQIFRTLALREDQFIKYFCFGNVSMLNGVRSVIRHYDLNKGRL